MKRKTLVILVAVGFLLVVGVVQGLAYVQTTMALYENAAPCGELKGVPRLLQVANFIPAGNCVVNARRGGCQNDGPCKLSQPPSRSRDWWDRDHDRMGHCTPSRDRKSCTCVADPDPPAATGVRSDFLQSAARSVCG